MRYLNRQRLIFHIIRKKYYNFWMNRMNLLMR